MRVRVAFMLSTSEMHAYGCKALHVGGKKCRGGGGLPIVSICVHYHFLLFF